MSGRSRGCVSHALRTALLLALGACATTGGGQGDSAQKLPAIVDPAIRAGAPTLLIAMPSSVNFMEVRKSLVSEVQSKFNVQTFIVGPQTRASDLAAAIRAAKPACVVLMNNATMALYRQYQMVPSTDETPPVVLLMASFLEEVQPLIRRSTGIAYEVPGITAFVNLRLVMSGAVNRVGVVYRPAFRRFVERQTALAARERIEVVSTSVPNDFSPTVLRDALHRLASGKKLDAIWLLNDNALVRDAELLDDAWRAETTAAKVPLIVGVPNFVDPSAPLGALAVVPDHEALGLQAANLIFDLLDNDWRVEGHGVELPLSVKTVVDVPLFRGTFGLRPDALKHIDKAME